MRWRVFIVLVIVAAPAMADEPSTVACPDGARSPRVAAASAEVQKNPGAIEARFVLADALSQQGCFADAVRTLEDAERQHPRNTEVQNRLRYARSLVTEQHYFEGLDEAQESARLSRNRLRCEKLADLKACDDILRTQPDDVAALVAKGDALSKSERPADAVLVFRRAAEVDATNETVRARLQGAEALRTTWVGRCQSGAGEAALQACQLALLRGADDEFAIQSRKAVLLQGSNRPGPALDSYIAANLLKPDDRPVALAIVALTDSTERKDALALAARGSALLTVGRAEDALTPLRNALALDPTLPQAKARLAAAQKLAKSQPAKQPALIARNMRTLPRTAVKTVEVPRRLYSNIPEPGRSH